jgi:integrase
MLSTLLRKRYWKPAVNRAELDPELRFHDLRHSCASILISRGAHPKEIQARLGHASITTTLDRYGHLLPSLDRNSTRASRWSSGRRAVSNGVVAAKRLDVRLPHLKGE